MSQNINIPDDLKAIAEAKATFATVESTEAKAPKTVKLKPTPVIEPTEAERKKAEELRKQFIIDENLTGIEGLIKLYRQFNKTEATIRDLKKFEYSQDEEESSYGASTITITDSKRNEFKTQNPRLVEALVKSLNLILENKKTELGEKIANIEIKA